MSLTKWFRKNNKRLMAIVVVFLMIGFVLSAWLGQMRTRGVGGHKAVIATLKDGQEITNYQLSQATSELEILKMLKTDIVLRSIGLQQQGDLRAVFLGELIFPEQGSSGQVINAIKQIVNQNGYDVTAKQINDIYKRDMSSSVYWLLLTNETARAGIRASQQETKQLLGSIIPQLFQQATYSQVIGGIIRRINVSEDQIVDAFGKVLAVMQYSSLLGQSENVTSKQLMYDLSNTFEKLNAETVEFKSATFMKDVKEPSSEALQGQFEKYKDNFAGQVSKENPYGFGYKLHEMVQFEYMAVNIDEIKTTLPAVTEEEKEEYFANNRGKFVDKIPSDPNDPNSPEKERQKTYTEVSYQIGEELLTDRANAKAEKILLQAKQMTEAKIEELGIENNKITGQQFKQNAGDYKETAQKLSADGIKVYEGQTGLLNAEEINSSKTLSMLFIDRQGSYSGVIQLAFSVDPLNSVESGPLDQKVRLYENIGPLKQVYGKSMAMLRVIDVRKAGAPDSLDQVINKNDMTLGTPVTKNFAIKEKVAEDLKNIVAMEGANAAAEKFVTSLDKNNWEKTITAFNKLYGGNEKDPNAVKEIFKIEKLDDGLQRVTSQNLDSLEKQSKGNPLAQIRMLERQKQAEFVDKLYSLIPADSNTVAKLPVVLDYKPKMTIFVIKSISVDRMTKADFEKYKPLQAEKAERLQSQSSAAVYFNPQNIIERTGFKWTKEQQEMTGQKPVEANTDSNSAAKD